MGLAWLGFGLEAQPSTSLVPIESEKLMREGRKQ